MRRHTLYKYISRAMACLMAFALLLPLLSLALATETTEIPETTPAAPEVTASGQCGPSLSWTFDSGTLTISGSGAMNDFPESTMAPWYHLRGEIMRVSLPEGLTSVGDLAFYECTKVKTIVIPNSVTRIGIYAFSGCTGLELLNLGTGVRRIEEGAFSECYKIAALWLPEGLEYIGLKAFYSCRSITTVLVPQSVTYMGLSAFAYCQQLITAEIRANIHEVPEYLFYGCDMLSSVVLSDNTTEISDFSFRNCENLGNVYYGGTSMTEEEIRQSVSQNIPDFEDNGYVGATPQNGTSSAGNMTQDANGQIIQENTTVHPGENSTVSSTVTGIYPENSLTGNVSGEITVVVGGESGWQEAEKAVDDALEDINRVVTSTGSTTSPTDITIYVQNEGEVNKEFIENLANRDVKVTIITQDGSTWKIDTTNMESGSGAYDLRYDVAFAGSDVCTELGIDSCFRLTFRASAQINSEVLIRIGEGFAMQNATLLQRGKEMQRIQSSVVDMGGNAHFYLGAVDAGTEYYVAINLPDITSADVIIPQEMNNQYGNPVQVNPITYEITGPKSSWGMSFNQVTWIMIAFLGTTVIVVGVVMYTLNKRRLRMGYVPDLDDEDEV